MFGQVRAFIIVILFGCACGTVTPPICPDAGNQNVDQLCSQWINATERLCMADSGVCGPVNAFDCPASCTSLSPFHCPGFALSICGQGGVDDLNQILDAGTCADLIPTAFGQATCDGYYNPEPK